MRHTWILDVLTDLRSYAEMNNLPAVAAAAKQTYAVAVAEMALVLCDDANKHPAHMVTD